MTQIKQIMEFAKERNKQGKSMFCHADVARDIFGRNSTKNRSKAHTVIGKIVKRGGLIVAPIACECTGTPHKQYRINNNPSFIQGIDRVASHREKIMELFNEKEFICVHDAMSKIGKTLSVTSGILSKMKNDSGLIDSTDSGKCKVSGNSHPFYFKVVKKDGPEVIDLNARFEAIKPEKKPEIADMSESIKILEKERDKYMMLANSITNAIHILKGDG